jgi:two-component system response regulator DevR
MFIETQAPIVEQSEREVEVNIRILIAGSSETIREGLRHMLVSEGNITIVGEAKSEQEIASVVKQTRPDLVIIDGHMLRPEATHIASQLKSIDQNVNTIILNDKKKLIAAVQNEVAGFVTGDISRIELVTMIRIIFLWRLVLFKPGMKFTLVRV